MAMQKVGLLLLLLGILSWCEMLSSTVENPLTERIMTLSGRQESTENLRSWNESWIQNIWIWEQMLILYPFWKEQIQKADYSWMTVQKLYNDPAIRRDSSTHCGKDYLFLNTQYGFGDWELLSHQEWPTKSPLYLNWESDFLERWGETFLNKLEGNLLITWYLITNFQNTCWDCNEEEEKKSPQAEIRKICSQNKKTCKGFSLGYTEWGIQAIDWEKTWGSILALYPNLRLDSIKHFSNYNKCTPSYEINLRNIANDGKLHTFRIILDDGGAQERAYFWSMVREWDFIK